MSVRKDYDCNAGSRISPDAEVPHAADQGDAGATSAQAAHTRSRREFTEMCAKLSISVPPAVMLLASSDQALASVGAREPRGNGRGPVSDTPVQGGRGPR